MIFSAEISFLSKGVTFAVALWYFKTGKIKNEKEVQEHYDRKLKLMRHCKYDHNWEKNTLNQSLNLIPCEKIFKLLSTGNSIHYYASPNN